MLPETVFPKKQKSVFLLSKMHYKYEEGPSSPPRLNSGFYFIILVCIYRHTQKIYTALSANEAFQLAVYFVRLALGGTDTSLRGKAVAGSKRSRKVQQLLPPCSSWMTQTTAALKITTSSLMNASEAKLLHCPQENDKYSSGIAFL